MSSLTPANAHSHVVHAALEYIGTGTLHLDAVPGGLPQVQRRRLGALLELACAIDALDPIQDFEHGDLSCGCTPDPDTGELHDTDGWQCSHG